MQDPSTIYSSKAQENSFQVTFYYSQWGYPVTNMQDKKKNPKNNKQKTKKPPRNNNKKQGNSFQIHEDTGTMSGTGRYTLPPEHTTLALNIMPITIIFLVSRFN